MKAIATNFLKFLQGTKQFIIPIYQRTYSKGDTCSPKNQSNEKPINAPRGEGG